MKCEKCGNPLSQNWGLKKCPNCIRENTAPQLTDVDNVLNDVLERFTHQFTNPKPLNRAEVIEIIKNLLLEARIDEVKKAKSMWVNAPDDSDFIVANGERLAELQEMLK